MREEDWGVTCIEQDWGLDPEVGYDEGCLDEGIYY